MTACGWMTVTGVGGDGWRAGGGVPNGSAEPLEGWSGRGRAAVIAAVAVEVCWLVAVERQLSAGGGWERLELLERGEEVAGPGPGVLEVQLRLAAVERESGGDVQQLVAQPLGLGLGELA